MNKTISIILPYYNRKNLLKITLDSYSYFYKKQEKLEIIIVDDFSDEEHRLENLISDYKSLLNIKLIRIKEKKGYNPSYAYNVGARHSNSDILILSCPEIFHTQNIFNYCDFDSLNKDAYFQFSCFCLTDKDSIEYMKKNIDFVYKDDYINNIKNKFYENLGELGYPYNNSYGSWYTHSKIKPSCLNFLSALSRETYYEIGGFNEEFMNGTGYDDTDFKDRLLKHINNNVVWFDNFISIHIDHEIVKNLQQNTNASLYNRLQANQTYKKNDDWGKL